MRCKLIAEVGWNHMGDMTLAKDMINAAKQSGADYVKFQTWSVAQLKPGPWDEDGRREIYEKAELSESDHKLLKQHCDDAGVKFLTSCFNPIHLNMIRGLTNEIKIPSTECFNKELVSKSVDMFDHLYISTGATSHWEFVELAKIDKVTLLHCVSTYPCPAENINLPRMTFISNLTPRWGYSGHYSGIWDAVAAISMGATVVEKHFTIDNKLPGRDNKFALLPEQFSQVSEYAHEFEAMSVSRGFDYSPEEQEARDKYAGRWTNESS